MERESNSQDKPELEQKGACGSTWCQVQKILQSREEPTPEADTEEDTNILTSLMGLDGLCSPLLVPLLKKGPWWQLSRREEQADQPCEHTVLTEVSKTTLLPQTFDPGCSTAQFSTG